MLSPPGHPLSNPKPVRYRVLRSGCGVHFAWMKSATSASVCAVRFVALNGLLVGSVKLTSTCDPFFFAQWNSLAFEQDVAAATSTRARMRGTALTNLRFIVGLPGLSGVGRLA